MQPSEEPTGPGSPPLACHLLRPGARDPRGPRRVAPAPLELLRLGRQEESLRTPDSSLWSPALRVPASVSQCSLHSAAVFGMGTSQGAIGSTKTLAEPSPGVTPAACPLRPGWDTLAQGSLHCVCISGLGLFHASHSLPGNVYQSADRRPKCWSRFQGCRCCMARGLSFHICIMGGRDQVFIRTSADSSELELQMLEPNVSSQGPCPRGSPPGGLSS